VSKIAALRRELATLQGLSDDKETENATLPFGLKAIDAHLGGGLRIGHLHEFNGFAAWTIAVWLAGNARGDVLWCTLQNQRHSLYPPGLVALSLDPRRLIHAWTNTKHDLYWAAEEGLREGSVKTVVIETPTPMPLTVARRLQLAAEASNTPALIVSDAMTGNTRSKTRTGTTTFCPAATTRWQVNPQARTGLENRNRLHLSLIKNRSGALGQWQVEWDETAHRLRLVAQAGNRPAHPGRLKLAG